MRKARHSNRSSWAIAFLASARATCLFALLCLSPVTQADRTQPASDQQIRELLEQLTQQVILPIYSELNTHVGVLTQATDVFCTKPDQKSLAAVRQAWRQTLSSWQQSSPLLFGPATENDIDFTLYFRPVKKSIINTLLASANKTPALAITREQVKQAGVGGQGLATLEYLLFDREQDDKSMITSFSVDSDQQKSQARCDYLQATTALLATNVQVIQRSWQPAGGNYAAAFYTAGQGSAYFTEAHQPMELWVNRLYQAAQAIDIKKLRVPMGLHKRHETPRAYPYKLEAWRSGHSWQNIHSTLRGIQRSLKDGGVLSFLATQGHTLLASTLQQQLQSLLQTTLPDEDLFKLLQSDPTSPPLQQFHQQLIVFNRLIRTGLAPALGVQLGFNQNDGD